MLMVRHHRNTLSVIIMPVRECNARCRYCFVPPADKDRKMSLDEAGIILTQFARYMAQQGYTNLNLYWQGGEAMLLSPQWYDEMAEQARKIFDPQELTVRHHLQTNLLLYETRWAATIRNVFNGKVGTSLDYPNLYRSAPGIPVDRYEQAWLERYRQLNEDGLGASPICVPNRLTLENGPRKLYDHFVHELGIKKFQINYPFPPRRPDAGRESGTALDWFLPPRELGEFLSGLFKLWYTERQTSDVAISPFAALLGCFEFGEANGVPCVYGVNCSQDFLSVMADGNVSLCDYWVSSQPGHLYGNLYEQPLKDVLKSGHRHRFVARTAKLLKGKCGRCPYVSLCHGGCPTRAYNQHGELTAPDKYCETHIALLKPWNIL